MYEPKAPFPVPDSRGPSAPAKTWKIEGSDGQPAPTIERQATGLELDEPWTLRPAGKIESSRADGGLEPLCSAASPQLSAR